LVVRDPEGAEGRTVTLVDVGNSSPLVRITHPADGGFIDYGVPFDYRVEATDPEDGPLGPEKVSVYVERRDRLSIGDETMAYPGLVSMRAGTCFACHRTAERSAGPGYADIAKKYISDPASRETLAQKILRGGSGVWGEIPMPPHPQVSVDQARLMVDWILSLASRDTRRLDPGMTGRVAVDPPPREWGAFSNGVVLLTASATDAGTAEAPPLSAESRIALRTRRQMAAAFDRGHRVSTQHNLESGLVARVVAGGWFAFDHIRLADVPALRFQLHQSAGPPARLEVRAQRPDGPLLASATLPASDPRDRRRPALTLELPAAESSASEPVDLVFALVGDPAAVCDIEWIEFK
jgi:cytochrome c